MFSERAILRNRARNDRNLPHTATFKEPRRTGAGEGGNYDEDYLPLFSAPCRVAPSDIGASPNEHDQGEGVEESQTRWWVILSWNVEEVQAKALRASHKVTVVGKDSPESPAWTKELEVLAVMAKRSNRIMTKVLCLERD